MAVSVNHQENRVTWSAAFYHILIRCVNVLIKAKLALVISSSFVLYLSGSMCFTLSFYTHQTKSIIFSYDKIWMLLRSVLSHSSQLVGLPSITTCWLACDRELPRILNILDGVNDAPKKEEKVKRKKTSKIDFDFCSVRLALSNIETIPSKRTRREEGV